MQKQKFQKDFISCYFTFYLLFMRSSGSEGLIPFDSELERTVRRIKKEKQIQKYQEMANLQKNSKNPI
ncbi:hypothetical protein, partial [Bacillus amyloliquefaciens]|uniref:hypothetical protein n=1 Tax=Bacillus amyloliquefaciens TaxID=1390 RepID=UPI00197AB63F